MEWKAWDLGTDNQTGVNLALLYGVRHILSLLRHGHAMQGASHLRLFL
jgi:hypothetical protein